MANSDFRANVEKLAMANINVIAGMSPCSHAGKIWSEVALACCFNPVLLSNSQEQLDALPFQ